ncbi:MAG: hypothetical protein ACUVWP_00665 [bacterium]
MTKIVVGFISVQILFISGLLSADFNINRNIYNILLISQDSDDCGITFLNDWVVYSSSDRFNGKGGWDLWIIRSDKIFPNKVGYFSGLGFNHLSILNRDISALIEDINTTYNEAAPSYCPPSQKLYFHSNKPKGYGLEDLYEASVILSEKKGVIIKDVKNIGNTINSPFIDVCPSVSDDGKIMIFSSNRDGGYGGLDLWFSIKDKKNNWSEPVNMGPIVNTSGNEKYPYITNIGLFWASDGRDDSENFDIYFTSNYVGNNQVVRLPSPINSQFNDWGLALYNDKYIVWSSDRPSGAGGVDFLYIEIPQLKPNIIDMIISILD